MIIRINSLTHKILSLLSNPVGWLPPVLPLQIEHARVGSNCHTWARVIWVKRSTKR